MSKKEKTEELLTASGVKMHFPVYGGLLRRAVGAVKAVDGVSLTLRAGETLGLVGESGCGKSTLGKCLVRLYEPTAGRVVFEGNDITCSLQGRLRVMRRHLQMVFQDPAESLDARYTVADLLAEPLLIHKLGDRRWRQNRIEELLEMVGLPKGARQKFPHEFSGGQRQRISIARALALEPKVMILDEPVSALDVSVQAQVLNLLLDLQEELGLSYLFIAHDLAVVNHMSDRVAVMYLGKIVEEASAEDIYKSPKHAYTKALLDSIPEANPLCKHKKVVLSGDVPSPINPPKGSAYGHRIEHPRYKETVGMDLSLREIAPGHLVAADPCCLEEEDYLSLTESND